MNHTICLTDKEAALAATGELKALVRVMKPQPPAGTWVWYCELEEVR